MPSVSSSNGYSAEAMSGNEISIAFEQRLRELVNQHAREIHILESENQRLVRINQALKDKASINVLDEFPELIWGLDGDVQEPPRAPQSAERAFSKPEPVSKEQKQTANERKAARGTASVSVKHELSGIPLVDDVQRPSRISFSNVASEDLPELEQKKKREPPPRSKCVISSDSTLAQAINGISVFLILYVATVFPYKLCFVDFSLAGDPEEGWDIAEATTQWLFVFDLLANFFIAYTDKDGNEVFNFWLVAKHYVCTFMFWVNAIACVPGEFVAWIAISISGPDAQPGGANKALLILRLQRVTRIARMLRMAKLANL